MSITKKCNTWRQKQAKNALQSIKTEFCGFIYKDTYKFRNPQNSGKKILILNFTISHPKINTNPNTDDQEIHPFIYIYIYNPKHTCIFL